MQIGDRVEIKDRTNVLFKSRGVVRNIHEADHPWRGEQVIVHTDDGRCCCAPPEALRKK